MVDASVQFLLLNLKQLLQDNAKLISGVEDQVGSLYNELSMLTTFLKDSTENCNQHETVKELVRQIRDVLYEAGDVIDNFVVHSVLNRVRNSSKFIRSIDYPAALRTVAKKIQPIKNLIDVLYRK
ncbi:hypothetical protein U1Q18_001980 [Sarracenia purpurea var. burkii]